MDLAVAKELPAILPRSEAAQARRLVTCFGVLPNMQPAVLLPNLRRLLRERDLLLVSANLIPRPCQAPEAKALLRLYDNPATRDWLWLLLLDCGFEKADGELRFVLERVSPRLEWWQVIAFFCLRHDRVIRFGSKEVPFRAGETMRLFFSNRFTGLAFRSLLARHGLRVLADWRADQIDEGNFTCEREFS
jgi:SAM-dependent methyltransferase